MQHWIQLNLFTGESISRQSAALRKQQRHRKTESLALAVQLSIARMDTLQDTTKLISELCEQITGITYPINLDERHHTYKHQHRKTQTETVSIEPEPEPEPVPKRKVGRPRGTAHPSSTDTAKQQRKRKKEERIKRNAEIRNRFFQGNETQCDIVRDTGLSPSTVHNIIHRKAGQP